MFRDFPAVRHAPGFFVNVYNTGSLFCLTVDYANYVIINFRTPTFYIW